MLPGATLHAALDVSATAVEPYGPDHERLAEAARTVAQQATAVELEAWKEHGRAMNDQQAIAYALVAVRCAVNSST